ncbi:MAG: alpha-hydroxy acid oxidase [Rhodospirillaceae bacterium]
MDDLPPPISLDDYEAMSRRVLDPNAAAYFHGGAGDETTLRWNRETFARYAIVPRVLRKTRASASLELLGRDLVHPILVAPIAYQRMAHSDGEIGTARGATAQDALMVLSTLASQAMEAVRAAGPSCRWFQLYLQPSREGTLALLRRAEEAGFEAIVCTVDAPLSGLRNREQRVGFRLPDGIDAVNLPAASPQRAATFADGPGVVFQEYMRVAADWDDIDWLIRSTALPVVLKGIAAPEDARRAVEIGTKAIVVSNHGGRTLDTIPASLDLLGPVAAAVGGDIPVLLDGGIRRGTDVFKALALGAKAVMIGRPVVNGLSVSGALGVSHVLRILRDEFELAMVLTGCVTLSEITRDRLVLARYP